MTTMSFKTSVHRRSSNFELMRIIMMLAIISHHYVVNSGIQTNYDYNIFSKTMLFLQCIGFSGKAMINGFILLTGYFMCKQPLSLSKIARLYFEIKLYKLLIYVLMVIGKF